VEEDQLTIEGYWGLGDGTSPRWGEDGGDIALPGQSPRNPQDNGALVTPDSHKL
jgi:hypothetical protein